MSEFDIIFAGGKLFVARVTRMPELTCLNPGGTTACVVAGRLIAANPSLKILIIERGQHSRDIPIHVQPCRFIENIAPTSTTASFHTALPSDHVNGRAITVPSGKCVGGGSAINCKQSYWACIPLSPTRVILYSHGVRARRRVRLR